MKAAVLYGKEDVRIEQIGRALEAGRGPHSGSEAALPTVGQADLKVFKRGYQLRKMMPRPTRRYSATNLPGVISENGSFLAFEIGGYRRSRRRGELRSLRPMLLSLSKSAGVISATICCF